ncbi:hypothetical protein [Nonomuraea helvata]|uniref:Excreted virulence factor EspC (Type VII ESX diderm) n=1 Tax=Nonomuraea helvata TaxID=37484 RepID=A0ABV5RZL8_9ACTN
MSFDGVAFSKSHLDRLACAADGMAGDVADVRVQFETSSSAARAALGDDDYGLMYWQARGPRMESVGAGLDLLAAALQKQESRIRRASHMYDACEDAGTLRTSGR